MKNIFGASVTLGVFTAVLVIITGDISVLLIGAIGMVMCGCSIEVIKAIRGEE